MVHTFARRALTFAFVLSCTVSGCSNDRDRGPGGPGGTAPSCSDVCARVASLCGATPPDCASTCATFSDAVRSCVDAATSCAAVDACATAGSVDAGGGGGGGADAGGGGGGGCSSTPTCSDPDTATICRDGINYSTPCSGKPCALGRCGACTEHADCQSITVRCRCSDGTDYNTAVDGSCGDSMGGMMFCSHPSISSDVCATGAFEEGYGYLGTGCVSSVDPLE